MKNGKAPTREQKKIMKAHGLVPENWLVVKNLPDSLEVVSRVSLKSGMAEVVTALYGSITSWMPSPTCFVREKLQILIGWRKYLHRGNDNTYHRRGRTGNYRTDCKVHGCRRR